MQGLICVDNSTIKPAAARKIADALKGKKGLNFSIRLSAAEI